MAEKWTPAQSSAIETRNKTLLVSAAAGSGKTATLTERIIRSLTDSDSPADISRMLVATFTRASAADLRVKISAALSKKLEEDPTNKRLADQLVALGSAHISTIDSFYSEILKTHFSKIGLACAPRTVDDSESKPLNISVMNEVIDRFYESFDGFDKFVENFTSVRDNSKVGETFISIYEKLLSQKEGVDKLKVYIKNLEASVGCNIFDTKYGDVAREKLGAFLDFALSFTKKACEETSIDTKAHDFHGVSYESDLALWTRLSSLVDQKDYDGIKNALDTHEKIAVKQLKGDQYADIRLLNKVRTEIYKDLDKIRLNYFCYTGNEIAAAFADNVKICKILHSLLSEFDKQIMAEKASRGICTFGDIRRFVLDILCDENGNPNDIALEYRSRFDYVYVDEYQDVDPVQHYIFSILSKPDNKFMVGDIKQSIYGFRNADPSIFKAYKTELPLLGSCDSDGYSLFMSNNFRCDETVIDFSNAVSSFLFSNRAGSIGYTKDDDLIFSRKNPNPEYIPTPVKVVTTGIIGDTSKDDLSDQEKEELKRSSAKYVAEEILRLVKEETLADVQDESGSFVRNKIGFGDIAVLSRQKSVLPELIEELEKRGIPVECEKESDFFENPDVLLVLSLLSAIDNPQKDISLAGTLRSPFFGFTYEEICTIKFEAPDRSYSLYDSLKHYSELDGELAKKCAAFIKRLNEWRSDAASASCDKLIKKLYHDLAILSYGSSNEKNLQRLYEYAIKFESSGFKGLYGFVKYVNDLIACKVKMPDASSTSGGNAVRIMTIHKSKGLEFPVCFIYGCEKGFSTNSSREDIQYDPSIGIGFTPHDESGFAKFESPTWRAICDTRKELEREEEMRILYVAMTRARERLYVVSNIQKPQNKETARLIAKFDPQYGIMRTRYYYDWIMMALDCPDIPDCYEKIDIDFSCSGKETQASGKPTEQAAATEITANEELVRTLKERFDFKYPYEHVSKLPAKLAVSSLSPDVLDIAKATEATPADMGDSYSSRFGSSFVSPDRLLEEKAPTAAERGTATHAFLQFCDFKSAVANGVKNEIDRLIDDRFIPFKYRDLIDVSLIEGFLQSELYKRMSEAKRIYREQRFNLFLPASQFTKDETLSLALDGETIAVQGVIDIFFEDRDGNIVLCDYKTDYLTKSELEDREAAAKKLNAAHSEQLSYYAKAVEEMLGKYPDEILIYSLPLKSHVKIDVPKGEHR